MGRELKRVPLNFDWPINMIWAGYLNPHRASCPEEGKTCFNGHTAAGQWLESICRLMGLLAEQALEAPQAEERRARGCIYPHPYLEEWSQAPRTSVPDAVIQAIRDKDPQDEVQRNLAFERAYRAHPPKLLPLTPELQHLIEALAGKKARVMMGGGFAWSLAKRLKEFAGVKEDDNWGICPVCKGHNIDPAIYEAHEAWTSTDPPKGEGYQLWTTTNEGSPMSPVFATLDELCAWCEPNASVFGYQKTTKERWREMLDADFVRHEVEASDGTKLVFM